ncbi:MAG: phosphate signaling complex protein PhoU [Candidatus Nanopelagicales bacterium]|nr:phosphate signaling complex protein PhoU [Candidatus Nanopelagicales bacterium]MDD2819068.1 phosphate signaling complex protein PhoU [Candidatus Nanopelagicales bacterium]
MATYAPRRRRKSVPVAYAEDLEAVNAGLVEVADLVGSAMFMATQSLLDADNDLAQAVIAQDERIDILTSQIEERCFDLISLQQPTDRDLRILIGSLRIAASLERMGDLASHVAKQARMRFPNAVVPEDLRETFEQMGALAQAIVTKTAQVIATKDLTLATDIAAHDEVVDRLHRELFRAVLNSSWEHGVETAIDITLLSRYYERYADHAVSVTRRLITIVTGEPYVGVSLKP